MSVQIRIDQAAKSAGVAGRAREDLDVGTLVTLTAVGGPFLAYQWSAISRPIELRTNARASSVLSSPSASTTTFTPIDVRGTYYVQLAVDSGSGLGASAADVARITFYAGIAGDRMRGAPNADPRLLPRRMPATGEKAEHNVPDGVDVSGNIDGWAKEMYRWERVWQTQAEGMAWAAGRVGLTGAGATLVRGWNVATVTRTGVGVVVVTFSVAMPDTSYSVIGSARSVGGGVTVSSELTGSCVIERGDVGGSLVDAPFNFRVELGV